MDITLNTCGWCKEEEIMEQTIIQFFFMVWFGLIHYSAFSEAKAM